MKKIIILGLLLTTSLVHARTGSEGVGGGDLCEDRIKIIRDDLSSWISKKGSNDLQLPSGVSNSDYSQAMLEQIKKTKIRCVGAGDEAFPIQIDNTPKVCRFDKTQTTSQISCDFNKFQSMSESEQYVLIHHEFAGLADIEVPNGDDSDYKVSNQISEYLVDQVVKRLAIKPVAGPSVACSSLERSAPIPVGTRCTTSLNVTYKRVLKDHFGEAWQGPDGLIWSDVIGRNTHKNAEYICKNLGGALPTKADFEKGEANGFREVLPNFEDRWFWSSSIADEDPNYFYFFDGDNGDMGSNHRDVHDHIRCIFR